MDYNDISCGVAAQAGAVSADTKEKIHAAIDELFKGGYRRFLIALTGEATLVFAEAVLSLREQYPDAGIDLLIPYDGWIESQPEVVRYRQITAQAESVNESCEEAYEDSTDICNHQLIGFGRCMAVIHGGGDKLITELIEDAREAEQEVIEILI